MPELKQVNPGEVLIVPDANALSSAAAEEFVKCARAAIVEEGRFSVALSGGNTPRIIYSLLADQYRDSLPWEKIHIFFGDERPVPPSHPDSNYRMARESLLSRVAIPLENVHRIRAELPADLAAKQYAEELRNFFKLGNNAWPRFDLVLLGIGDEGHTASLFPDSAGLKEDVQLVVPNWIEKFHTWRITLTFPVLNHAAEVLFLVSGSGKAEILRDIFDPARRNVYPAQAVRPQTGRLLWLVDEAAAALL